MEPKALRNYPVFPTRPTEEFLSGWQRHIEETGSPETYDYVSTDTPSSSEDLYLLSENMRVPLSKREDGVMVPCPICSPHSPQFAVGRMAWFPKDRAVRFIGHDCASKLYKDNFVEAETRFGIEQKAIKAQALLTELRPNAHWLIDAAVKLEPIAKAMQECRAAFGYQFNDFAGFFYRNRPSATSEHEKRGQAKAIESVAGLSFLADTFRPYDQTQEVADALADAQKPLPDWSSIDGANEAAEEIVERGRRAHAAVKRLPMLVHDIREARLFLTLESFRRIDRWHRGGASPFASLSMKLEDGVATVRATSFQDNYAVDAAVPRAIFNDLPTKVEITFKFGKEARH